MATPTAKSYSAASGGTIVGGRFTVPAWMQAATVGQWTDALPGSTLSTGPNPNSFSGFVVDDELNAWFAAAGGHSDGTNNAVAKYPLGANSPAGWVQVRGPSTATPLGLPYFADGRPNARHTYESLQYDPDTRHLLLFGCYAPADGSNGYNPIDGFNIDTGEWEPQGTYPTNNGTALPYGENAYNGGTVRDPETGYFFWSASGANWQWKPGESSLTNRALAFSFARFPNAWDTSRSAIFGLQWGDGMGAESGVRAWQTINPSSGSPTKREITFNASAALSAFIANGSGYGAMAYDPTRDRFMFAHGSGAGFSTPTFYEIIPNSGAVWDMALPSWDGTPGDVLSTGSVGKLKYIAQGGVGGFIYYTDALYFLRTS